MRYIFVKSFYLCLHYEKISTTYVEIRIRSSHIWLNLKKLIFRIGFTVVTTCAKSCSKKLERLCAKEVYTFIMDSEAIFY